MNTPLRRDPSARYPLKKEQEERYLFEKELVLAMPKLGVRN